MRSAVINLNKKIVRPNISKLLEDNHELAEYIAELEEDNDFLRRLAEERRVRIMELTYIGGFIEVCHDVNKKYYREPYDLKIRTTSDNYRKIYKIYHEQLLKAGWPRIELTKRDIASVRRNTIEQAITDKIYTPSKPRKSKPGYKKKDKISINILKEIMPSPYKVHPDIVLGDEDHHFRVLLDKKGRKQKKKSGG